MKLALATEYISRSTAKLLRLIRTHNLARGCAVIVASVNRAFYNQDSMSPQQSLSRHQGLERSTKVLTKVADLSTGCPSALDSDSIPSIHRSECPLLASRIVILQQAQEAQQELS